MAITAMTNYIPIVGQRLVNFNQKGDDCKWTNVSLSDEITKVTQLTSSKFKVVTKTKEYIVHVI